MKLKENWTLSIMIGLLAAALIITALTLRYNYLIRPSESLDPLTVEKTDVSEDVYIKWADPATADRIIRFIDKDGVLDVEIEGYADMTEAAKEFFEHLKSEGLKEVGRDNTLPTKNPRRR